MDSSTIGVLLMLANSTFISFAGILFALSTFPANCVLFWIGCCGSVIGSAMCFLNCSRSIQRLFHVSKVLFLKSALNSCLLGALSNCTCYLSMEYIKPSETLVILFFTCTLVALLVEIFLQGLRLRYFLFCYRTKN